MRDRGVRKRFQFVFLRGHDLGDLSANDRGPLNFLYALGFSLGLPLLPFSFGLGSLDLANEGRIGLVELEDTIAANAVALAVRALDDVNIRDRGPAVSAGTEAGLDLGASERARFQASGLDSRRALDGMVQIPMKR